MSGKLYILSGASGCGKTTLLNNICSEPYRETLMTATAPKYSERAKRNDNDDVIHIPHIELGDFDIAYAINNTKYGIRTKEIAKLIDSGLNCFIILSDFRVIRRLKEALGERARAVYVASAIDADRLRRIQQERLGFSPSETQREILSRHFERVSAAARLGWWDRVSNCVSDLYDDWRAYATDSQATEIRAQRIRAFHIRYIEYLQLFDYVILNYSENRPEEMTAQMSNILSTREEARAYREVNRFPPIFIVAAASGAGKGTLMEMLNLIGRDRIAITSKRARREKKENDKRDGMIAIGRDGKFLPEFDLRWIFHKNEGAGLGGTEYAVSSQEINANIEAGRAQIFVSNIQQFSMFRERWPGHVRFLYLYRLSSEQAIRDFQYSIHDPVEAEARIAEIGNVHQDYIEKIVEFDHVLLNTSYPEDLYDQMFQLISHYEQKEAFREFEEWKGVGGQILS